MKVARLQASCFHPGAIKCFEHKSSHSYKPHFEKGTGRRSDFIWRLKEAQGRVLYNLLKAMSEKTLFMV